MLQTASTLSYQPLPVRPVKPLSKSAAHRRSEFAKRSNDLSVLYPQSVLRSSDSTGWQNVRAMLFAGLREDFHLACRTLLIPNQSAVQPRTMEYSYNVLDAALNAPL